MMKKPLITIVAVLLAAPFLFAQSAAEADSTASTRIMAGAGPETPVRSWRFSVHGGGAYRIGRVYAALGDDVKNYLKKLKFGPAYGVDATYFFSENYGAGVQFSSMYAFNREFFQIAYEDGTLQTGYLEDRLNITYAGPLFSVKSASPSGRHLFLANYGLGYLSYRDAAEFIQPYTLKGATLGCRLELAYDFRLTGNFFIGALLSLTSGKIYDYTVTDGAGRKETVKLGKDETESLTHLTLSVGLRWNL